MIVTLAFNELRLKMKHGWLVSWSLRLTNLLRLFSRIWIKGHFPRRPFQKELILAKSLIKTLADLVIFSTIKNRDESSVIILVWLLKKVADVQQKKQWSKKRGPGIEPYGILASVAAHEEYFSFKTSLCFRWYKKSVTIIFFLSPVIF